MSRTVPRFTLTKEAPPIDFVLGELAVNFPTKQLYLKGEEEVLLFPSLELIMGLIAEAQQPPGEGPDLSGVARVLYGNHEPVLMEQVGTFTARSFDLPAGRLGASSRLDIRAQIYPENGSNSEATLKLGGQVIGSTKVKKGRTYILERSLRARGSGNVLLSNSWGGNLQSVSGSYGAVDVLTVDSSQPLAIELDVRNTNTQQRVRVDSLEVVLWP